MLLMVCLNNYYMKTREELINEWMFDYLDDDKIKDELYSSAYYIFYLVDTLEKIEDEFIDFSVRHSIIVLLWWIIEVLLFQYVYKYFDINQDERKIKKFCKRCDYKEKSKVIEKDDNSEVWFVYCERSIKYEKFKDNINFNYLIKWARDQSLLSDIILEKIDKFRRVRNGVHLNVLLEIREVFSLNELTIFFKDNKKILKEIKKKYKEL